jgi:hypothetical protein
MVLEWVGGEKVVRPMTAEEISANQPVQIVPVEVSRFQAKAALSLAGKLEQAEAVVQASTDPLVKLAWAEALVFRRDSPSINGLASAIGLSSQDLDNLFIQAATIVA